MGRGLGDLQQKCLIMGYENYLDANRRYSDLTAPEIIRDIMGIDTDHPGNRWSGWHKKKGEDLRMGRNFEQTREYKSARASVSICIRRLEERGLVERKRKEIWLTEEGLRSAATLCEMFSE